MTGDDSAEAARSLLIEGLDELGLAATAHQLDTLLELAQLLGQWSKRINLTGHRTSSRDRPEADFGCSRAHRAAARDRFTGRHRVWGGLSRPSGRHIARGLSGDARGIPRAAASLSASGHSAARAGQRPRRTRSRRSPRAIASRCGDRPGGRAARGCPAPFAAVGRNRRPVVLSGLELPLRQSRTTIPGSFRALRDLQSASGRRGADAVERAQNFRECRVALREIDFWQFWPRIFATAARAVC